MSGSLLAAAQIAPTAGPGYLHAGADLGLSVRLIPIVFATHADPVGLGHIASLPRPGGNITGLFVQLTETTDKQLEILKETVPHATRIGVLWSPTVPSYRPFLQAEGASGKLGVQLLTAGVSTVADFDGAFDDGARSCRRCSRAEAFDQPLVIAIIVAHDRDTTRIPAAR